MSVASILTGTPAQLASIYGGGGVLPTTTGSGTGDGGPQTIVASFSSADNGVYILYLTDSTQTDNYMSVLYAVVELNAFLLTDSYNVITPQLGTDLNALNVPNGDAYTWKIVKLA